jgi:hypothetical protein
MLDGFFRSKFALLIRGRIDVKRKMLLDKKDVIIWDMRLAVAPTFIPEDVRRLTISLNRGYKGLITVLGVNPFLF